MKRTSPYFLKITHLALVEFKGKNYKREENIINGKISLSWMMREKNEYGGWNDIEHVGQSKLINELNKEYENMSYSENFKQEEDSECI